MTNTCYQLFSWLQSRQFDAQICSHLEIHDFSDTGRGMRATADLMDNDLILQLPHKLLVTGRYVGEEYVHIQSLSPYFSSNEARNAMSALGALEKLYLFLLLERHARSSTANDGVQHDWTGYIESLPQSFGGHVLYMSQDERQHTLARIMSAEFATKLQKLESDFALSQGRIEAVLKQMDRNQLVATGILDEYTGQMDARKFCWAYCAVNTRCIHLGQKNADDNENIALAPYLDMLNHSPVCRTKTCFNEETDSFEIRAVQPESATGKVVFARGSQVFITYGAYSNHGLLVEYGFIVPENPLSCVHYDTILRNWVKKESERAGAGRQMEKNIAAAESHEMMSNCAVYSDSGVSWRLLNAIRLLCMTHEEYLDKSKWSQCCYGGPEDEGGASTQDDETIISVANELRSWETIHLLTDVLIAKSRKHDSVEGVSAGVVFLQKGEQRVLTKTKRIAEQKIANLRTIPVAPKAENPNAPKIVKHRPR